MARAADIAVPAIATALLAAAAGCATGPADTSSGSRVPSSRAEAAPLVVEADPGDTQREPIPPAIVVRRLALAHRGLPPDFEGEIPPSERWIGVAKDPPSTPDVLLDGGNVRVNQDSSGQDQNETVISVSPLDPLELIAGANDYRTGAVGCGWYASRDGGLTWADGVLPEETYPFQGDPTVAHCADGSAIYVCLSFQGAFQPHGLFAYRTADAGGRWQGPFTILNRQNGFPFADKEWVACDTTGSAFANRAYTTWTDVGLIETPILLRYSADGGETWSANVRVSDGGSTQGSVIAVGPDGSVNVAWSDGAGGIGFDRSTDGGATFGADVFPSSVDAIPNDPVFRRNSFPSMDADRSAGPHSGNLYIAWADDRQGDPDILLVRSTDGGRNWSAPIRVNDDAAGNGADQFFPWVAVDPVGRVVVTFFDRRRYAGERPYEIWGAISRDGGATFDRNFLIGEAPSDGSLNGFVGDYSGLAATAERLYPLWTDLRAGTGETDAYTDRFPNTFRYDEVSGVAWSGPSTLDFDAQDARFGEDLDYDVASGLVSELRSDGDFSSAGCAGPAWGAPPFIDGREPPGGDGFWYLVRARGPAGLGSYGDGSPARPNVRDPLDETIAACP